MTSLDRPACGHVRWGRSASQSTASNAAVDVRSLENGPDIRRGISNERKNVYLAARHNSAVQHDTRHSGRAVNVGSVSSVGLCVLVSSTHPNLIEIVNERHESFFPDKPIFSVYAVTQLLGWTVKCIL